MNHIVQGSKPERGNLRSNAFKSFSIESGDGNSTFGKDKKQTNFNHLFVIFEYSCKRNNLSIYEYRAILKRHFCCSIGTIPLSRFYELQEAWCLILEIWPNQLILCCHKTPLVHSTFLFVSLKSKQDKRKKKTVLVKHFAFHWSLADLLERRFRWSAERR